MNKTISHVLTVFLLLISFNIYAVDCNVAFSDNSYTEKNDMRFVLELAAVSEQCLKEGASTSRQAALCASKEYLRLAGTGNYVAAEHLAENYCLDGKINESKAMLLSIVNNPDVPQYIKARCNNAMTMLNR